MGDPRVDTAAPQPASEVSLSGSGEPTIGSISIALAGYVVSYISSAYKSSYRRWRLGPRDRGGPDLLDGIASELERNGVARINAGVLAGGPSGGSLGVSDQGLRHAGAGSGAARLPTDPGRPRLTPLLESLGDRPAPV